jgi:hypothetical protein
VPSAMEKTMNKALNAPVAEYFIHTSLIESELQW